MKTKSDTVRPKKKQPNDLNKKRVTVIHKRAVKTAEQKRKEKLARDRLRKKNQFKKKYIAKFEYIIDVIYDFFVGD